MLQLALIFGGRSAEHDISLASARFVLDMLDTAVYEVVPIGITRDGRWLRPRDVAASLREGLENIKSPKLKVVSVLPITFSQSLQ